MDNLLAILTKPDNIPIVVMLLAMIYCLWISFRQALKNDRLIKAGKDDEIPQSMTE